ncbi:MAG: ABC transporter ATP-binding protein [Spirochaetaceae bacterium]|nr:MAG: ABC transporter ATP-binding protein [Spirochaetaceae bacterium]
MNSSQAVTVRDLTKRYGNATAVDSVSFTAEAGKLTTLLGPSGCGKTTTLRAVGGFITVDRGTIMIGDRAVDSLPPYRRPTRTVFQSYALFPHMSVRENVAFGLKATGTPRREIPGRVAEALQLVGLQEFAHRQSGQLSGGQQQRVAFARALVTRPEVLLLDEPLSNLDAKLRVQMRLEIRRLQQEVGITTIYVTHDQEEALSLSDTVIVMNEGRIEQQGTPWEIYEHPANRFVADFIGTSNIIPAEIVSSGTDTGKTGDDLTISCLGSTFDISRDRVPAEITGRCGLVIRPEHIVLGAIGEGSLTARVLARDYRGSAADYRLAIEDGTDVPGTELIAEVSSPTGRQLLEIGEQVSLRLDTRRVSVVPAEE